MNILKLFLISLLSLNSWGISPSKAYLGIISEGSGAGMFGHAFITFSDESGLKNEMPIFEYNLEVNVIDDDELDKMSLLDKVVGFMESKFKVFEHDFSEYLSKYVERNQRIYFYEIKLNKDQIRKIYNDLIKEKIDRESHLKDDYSILTRNCVTEIIKLIHQQSSSLVKEVSFSPMFYHKNNKNLKYLSYKYTLNNSYQLNQVTENGETFKDNLIKMCEIDIDNSLDKKLINSQLIKKIDKNLDICRKNEYFEENFTRLVREVIRTPHY